MPNGQKMKEEFALQRLTDGRADPGLGVEPRLN